MQIDGLGIFGLSRFRGPFAKIRNRRHVREQWTGTIAC